jgi:hypothetical protein
LGAGADCKILRSESVDFCVAQAFSLCALRPNHRFFGSGATDTG